MTKNHPFDNDVSKIFEASSLDAVKRILHLSHPHVKFDILKFLCPDFFTEEFISGIREFDRQFYTVDKSAKIGNTFPPGSQAHLGFALSLKWRE